MSKNINDLWEEYKKVKKASTIIKEKYTRNKIFNHSINSYSLSKNINNINQKSFSKQAVAKMISNLGKDAVKRCMDYILKNTDEPLLINEKGEKVSSDEVFKEWSKDFSKNENSKEAWHLMFSIKETPNKKNLEILKKCVQETMSNNFLGYKYVMQIHTHQNNPHIHIILNKRNSITKRKIHFNNKEDIKDFWSDVRTNFSISLSNKGLNYHNHFSFENDLKQKYQKIKNSLAIDDLERKKELSDMLLNKLNKEKSIADNKKTKIDFLMSENENLKQERNNLISLFHQYKKKKNKRFYTIGKNLKEINKNINNKENMILKEIQKLEENNKKINYLQKELNNISLDSTGNIKNYKHIIDFLYKHKISTKSDYENFKKMKSLILDNTSNDDIIRKNALESSTIHQIYNKKHNESIFKIERKMEKLDNSINLLKLSNAEFKEYEKYLNTLEQNKEFLKECANERFARIKEALENNKNISKNSFIFKEYKKACEILNIKQEINLEKSNKNNIFNKKENNMERNRHSIF
ncbi:TPA: relaxase/mobilization nuclease domain-containing protein [Campylobacter lari]|nr:relaxase/mobilization nuclease domain-containing protein [Campylobacter lari]